MRRTGTASNDAKIHFDAMNIEYWPIGQPIPYERPALKEFGWRQPIVMDKHGVIVPGHTRLAAAKQLGLEHVRCTWRAT
jgi:hypothetical protein